jgi:hypothetical protein
MSQRIRIIKLAERKRQAQARVVKRRAAASHSVPAQARDVATTVMGWIDELRQLKRQSTGAAPSVKSLLGDTA